MTEKNKLALEEYFEKILKYRDRILIGKESIYTSNTIEYKTIKFNINNYTGGIVEDDDLIPFLRRYFSHLLSHSMDFKTGEHLIPSLLEYCLGDELECFLIYDSSIDRCVFLIDNNLEFSFRPLTSHCIIALTEPEHDLVHSFYSMFYEYNTEALTGIEMLKHEFPAW